MSIKKADEGYVKVSLVNQSVFIRKKKSCPLRSIPLPEITYKNLKLLNKFLSERGKILPSRITNVVPKKQKALANAIKIARQLALISPIKKEF
ncbi:MAG: 30S ribosomal protein S18 [Alphaproteobacteria bacterium RIFCSPLOWO2_01_FULL_40_26]|nr:MAG: 30S ribosomal protein S18 [Alphaproteobacteria bacterium RIFCSPHIGHO2_02_FULL_40_34]OFW94386.1 MAG: 30S ribosomal protein S18 [Alphaproteobacteria bacterium RIFCSPLOWO2_01_FULL_40_26]OFX09466.1 MAG: 30S ribosomal protein S18 [Alphaproteobacteria bacterium RIFCSPLOWO2_02_FULL_40_19]OFX11833.1 MAG: 30S ribosomal protein S18 [Alphaproteobacteria bacterium RIFCSPLOWO2_12_FULL_40_11]